MPPDIVHELQAIHTIESDSEVHTHEIHRSFLDNELLFVLPRFRILKT